MTILLSLAYASYAIQVSDRLLTVEKGDGRFEPWDPVANKAVVLLGRDGLVNMAYTGPAHVGSVTTDEWLARVLSGEDPSPDQSKYAFAHVFGRPARFLAAHLTDVVTRLNEAVASRSVTHRLAVDFVGLRWQNRGRRAWPVVGKIAWSLGNGGYRWSMCKRRWGWESGRAFLSGASGRSERQARTLLRGRLACVDLRDRDQAIAAMIDVLRSLPPHDPTVGKDCMVTTIQRSSPHASIRYEPYDVRQISVVFGGQTVALEAAFTPWIVTPETIVAPSEIVGHGFTFSSGGLDFRVEDPSPGTDITIMRGLKTRQWRR